MLPRNDAWPWQGRPSWSDRWSTSAESVVSGNKALPVHEQVAWGGARILISPFNEMLIGATLFIVASLAFWTTRAPSGIALLWPGTAIAAALLIRLPHVRWSVAFTSVLSALLLANALVGHRPLGIAALFALINGVEIALMVAVFRFAFTFPYPHLSIRQAGVMAALFCFVIPGFGAAAAGLILRREFAMSFAQGTFQWWSSHAIGACLFGTPIILFSLREIRRLTRREFVVENAGALILGVAGCYLAIRHVRFPFVSMGLILLIASFRLGGFGTSVMSLAFGLLITQLWLMGIRPLGLDPATSMSESLIGLPVIALLATLMPPIAVGLGSDARRTAVRDLRRLQRDLADSYELVRVTLDSIGDAVITTDPEGRVQWLNPVAEAMTGWSKDEARSRPLVEVFNIVHAESRQPNVNPVAICLTQARSVGLQSHSTLISRSGAEFGIEDSTSPIRNAEGQILGAVLVFHDVTEQRRLTHEMSHRAAHDALTGLVNRAEFEARLSRLLAGLTLEGTAHVLMFIDLDEFKVVNDACGHSAGDQLLRQVSVLLQGCTRGRDTVARLGGDEFGVLLENCGIEQGQMIAQKICDQIEHYRFVHDDRRYRIGTSIGVVPVDLRWANSAAVMQAADTCCYAAKDAGRHRVHLWVESDSALQVRQAEMRWVNRLEAAMDENRFALLAQHVEPLAGPSELLHCEVLLRLVDDDGGLILPSAFLPSAERFHLASRVDRWVVRAVFAHLEAAETLMDRIGTLSVNLSGQSLGDHAFQRELIRMLRTAAFDVRKLCFEITETAVIAHLGDAKPFIEEVRSLGVRIALDDFGAGASSFSFLRMLPVDYIKIDGQFITGLLNDPLNNAAVRCICEVAKVVGVKTIAEFVEHAEIRESLRAIGVDLAQGYFIHRPEPFVRLLPRSGVASSIAPTASA